MDRGFLVPSRLSRRVSFSPKVVSNKWEIGVDIGHQDAAKYSAARSLFSRAYVKSEKSVSGSVRCIPTSRGESIWIEASACSSWWTLFSEDCVFKPKNIHMIDNSMVNVMMIVHLPVHVLILTCCVARLRRGRNGSSDFTSSYIEGKTVEEAELWRRCMTCGMAWQLLPLIFRVRGNDHAMSWRRRRRRVRRTLFACLFAQHIDSSSI